MIAKKLIHLTKNGHHQNTTNMKVKIFRHFICSDQEREMNKWFEETPNIKVTNVTQSSVYESGSIYTIISVYYKPIYRKQDTGPR